MLNDITKYKVRYELYSLDNYPENFFKEYLNDEYVRCANLKGQTINIEEELLVGNLTLIDNNPDLIPNWQI